MDDLFCLGKETVLDSNGFTRNGVNPLLSSNIYQDKIFDDQFLFSGSGKRLCQIATNEVPSFAMNTNAAILTVTLPVSRKTVRYYPLTGRIEEEPIP